MLDCVGAEAAGDDTVDELVAEVLVPSCCNVEVKAEPLALKPREGVLDVASWPVVVMLSLKVEDTV